MFKRIMVPVDLGHVQALARALDVAASLGKTFDCPVCYVGVTTGTPSSLAHTPKEYAAKLAAFAEEQGGKYGLKAESQSYASHDPSIDLDVTLLKGIDDIGADLVVMQSHIPNISDHLWRAHGVRVASAANVSVFIVR